MSSRTAAYLALERLLIDAEGASDPFCDTLRTEMMPFWEALAPTEREAFQARPGASPDERNPSQIHDASGPVRTNRELVAYLLLERLLIEAEQASDAFAETLRDALMPFWEAVSVAHRAALQGRTQPSASERNATMIFDFADRVMAVVPWRTADDFVASRVTSATLLPELPSADAVQPAYKAVA